MIITTIETKGIENQVNGWRERTANMIIEKRLKKEKERRWNLESVQVMTFIRGQNMTSVRGWLSHIGCKRTDSLDCRDIPEWDGTNQTVKL